MNLVTDKEVDVSEAAYRIAELAAGGCPIEAGLLGNLADNECKHGRLSGDRTPACGCWPLEAKPVVTLFEVLAPSRTDVIYKRREQVAALYATGATVPQIALELGVPYKRVEHDVRLLQQRGIVRRRYRERVAA